MTPTQAQIGAAERLIEAYRRGSEDCRRDARITKREYDDALDNMRQATIERCAQELDRLMMRAAAAAIRALKD